MLRTSAATFLLGSTLLACGGAGEPSPLTVIADARVDGPLFAATREEQVRFAEGDALFGIGFREADGLGPLYVRTSCASCHQGGLRGPGGVQKLVVVEADGVTPSPDQSALAYGHTVRPFLAAGATTPIAAPEGVPVATSTRLGPPVLGMGYLEAIADTELERVEREQAARGDGISGRLHRVSYLSEPNPGQPFHDHAPGQGGLIGRFGVKGRIASVDEFVADALQGDMGLTSPLRPSELANPDGLADDGKLGTDVDLAVVNGMADYLRLLEIPRRADPAPDGEALFERLQCAVCHVPHLRTRADYPIAALAGVDAPVYTDLLLHDLGDGLADGLTDVDAGPREWRTAPLIALSHQRAYLHDGRAGSLDQAVLLHDGPGSEASASIAAYRDLTPDERQLLLAFLHTL